MATPSERETLDGITPVHRAACKIKQTERCTCRPGYRAEAYDAVARKRKYRTFPNKKAARDWRQDMQVAIRRGELRVTKAVTLAEVQEEWAKAARDGIALNKAGERYKPSVLRGYRDAWASKIKPELGRSKVGEVRPIHVKNLVKKLMAETKPDGSPKYAPSTIRNTITALRVLFKWAISEELATSNPCDDVALPAGATERDNIVPVETALEMLRALKTPREQALWATAFFAGLRRGELGGLRWCDLDIAARTIRVRQAWDPGAAAEVDTSGAGRMVLPKSKAAVRELGFPDLLMPFLAALPAGGPEALVFGREGHVGSHVGLTGTIKVGKPFVEKGITATADAAWLEAGLPRLTLHECRHTYASVMIAAGVNIKTIQTWMGHSSITVTLDRYGHLLPGSAAEALGLLNAYIDREVGS